jgi:hypothetical protein
MQEERPHKAGVQFKLRSSLSDERLLLTLEVSSVSLDHWFEQDQQLSRLFAQGLPRRMTHGRDATDVARHFHMLYGNRFLGQSPKCSYQIDDLSGLLPTQVRDRQP